MGLIKSLAGGPVALDTVVFIHFIEESPRYVPLLAPLFAAVDSGRLAAFTSGITLLEVLVVPLRHGDLALAAAYEALLTRSRGLRLVPIDVDVLRAAARLRAETGAATPDAVQVAAAAQAGCRALVTNDRALPPFGGVSILQLDDYL